MNASRARAEESPPVPAIEPAQRTAARIAGAWYLIAMAGGIVGELCTRGILTASGQAAQTAESIAAAQRLFRVGTVSHLVVFVGDVVLLVALYVVLRPVSRNVALLAASLRLVDCSILSAILLNNFVALRLLSGADYLQVFDSKQLHALARVFIGATGVGFQVGFVFLGLGSAVFSWLWWRSRYVPRALAALGIFASLLMASVEIAILVFPALSAVVGMAFMAPMGLFEVGLGVWLLFRGIGAPAAGKRRPA